MTGLRAAGTAGQASSGTQRQIAGQASSGTQKQTAGRAGSGIPRGRRGITLLELLVTIFIIVTLTATAIPLIRPSLEGRRQREASRLLATYVEGVRAKALESGGSYGIWIDREPNNPHIATSIYTCRVPEPYSGESEQSRAILRGFVPLAAPLNVPAPTPRAPYAPWDMAPTTPWGLVVTVGIPGQPTSNYTTVGPADWWDAFLQDSNANGTVVERRILQEGDIVELDGKRTRYRIALAGTFLAEPGSTNAVDWLLVPVDGATQPVADLQFVVPPPPAENIIPRAATFQVFRQPQKTADRPLLLPGGVVIDLMSSGTGAQMLASEVVVQRMISLGVPIEFETSPPERIRIRMGWETFFPLQDEEDGASNNGKRFPRNSTGSEPRIMSEAVEKSPIVFLFGPSGTIERVWQPQIRDLATFNLSNQWSLVGTRPLDSIYLLLAKREQMPSANSLNNRNWPTTLRKSSETGEYQSTWRDGTNIWAVISPTTGKVQLSPVAVPRPNLDTVYLAIGPRTIDWHYVGITDARKLARQGVKLGDE